MSLLKNVEDSDVCIGFQKCLLVISLMADSIVSSLATYLDVGFAVDLI
jgi:hypothetical protein